MRDILHELVGIDGTKLNSTRISTLEEILSDMYGPSSQPILVKRFKSRKNIVVHLQINPESKDNPVDVVAKLFVTEFFEKEIKILRLSQRNKLSVPAIINARDSVLLMTYISGETLVDRINRTFDADLIDNLAFWYYKYHNIHEAIKGDPRLRNFICNNGTIYGVDFEESRSDHWIHDIAGISASLLDTNPIFDPRKRTLSWRLFERYLSHIGEVRSKEMDSLFARTVSEALAKTARWRNDDNLLLLSDSILHDGF
ncbi:MAG: hypothetical protein RTU30_08190 [Candidatus Thorarchaeota archaeon]